MAALQAARAHSPMSATDEAVCLSYSSSNRGGIFPALQGAHTDTHTHSHTHTHTHSGEGC